MVPPVTLLALEVNQFTIPPVAYIVPSIIAACGSEANLIDRVD